jgi:hypothetical protein
MKDPCRWEARMKLLPLCFLLLGTGACLSGGGYVSARVVYAEPPARVYEGAVDHVMVVTREVLAHRGYVVYRVEADHENRIVWARRGNDEVVRVFLTPRGRRVAVRSIVETREYGRRRVWVRRGPPADELVGDIDIRLREH